MVSAVPEDSENHTLFSGIYPFTQKKDSGNGSQGGSPLDENELMFVLFVCLFVVCFLAVLIVDYV